MTTTKPPIWFWIISALALIWYVLGVYYYLQQAYNTTFYRSMYTPEQLMIVDEMPAWATAAFAIAVFAGIFGVFGLILRKKWAKTLFLISVLGIVLQYIYNVFIGKMYELFSITENVRYFIIPIIAYLLFYIASKAQEKYWYK